MTTPNVPEKSVMLGSKTLLMGPAGTGKTYALGSIVDAGYELFYLGLENGIESLIGRWVDKGLPIPPNFHWATAAGQTASFAEQLDNAVKANTLSLESLAKLNDTNKTKYDGMRKLLGCLNNFQDERTKQSFGPVDTWDYKRVIAIDGLTGIGEAAMSNLIGGKAVRNQSDWGIAQSFVMNTIKQLTDNVHCHVVLLAHIERETDQVLGGVKLMPATLGKAISGLIAPKFSDVILTVREGSNWKWDTANPMADLKTRSFPISNNIPPDFAPIFKKWEARKAAMEALNV